MRNLRAETSCIPRKGKTSCIPTKNGLCVPTTNPPLSLKFAFSLLKNLRSRLQSVRTSQKTDFRKLKITLMFMTYQSQRPQCPSLSAHVRSYGPQALPTPLLQAQAPSKSKGRIGLIMYRQFVSRVLLLFYHLLPSQAWKMSLVCFIKTEYYASSRTRYQLCVLFSKYRALFLFANPYERIFFTQEHMTCILAAVYHSSNKLIP